MELKRAIKYDDVEFVKHLLTEDPTCIYPYCLFGASSTEIVKLLIPFVDLEERNPDGYTAIQYAAFRKYYGVVRLLLEAGASPLNVLVWLQDVQLMKEIAPLVPAEEVNRRIEKALGHWNETDIVQVLIDYCTDPLLINKCKYYETAMLFVPLQKEWDGVTILSKFRHGEYFVNHGALVMSVKPWNDYLKECRVRLLLEFI